MWLGLDSFLGSTGVTARTTSLHVNMGVSGGMAFLLMNDP